MVTCVEMPGKGVVEGKDEAGGLGGRVTSICSPVDLPSQDSSNNSNSSQQEHSHIRSTGFVKENGSFIPNQERISSVSAVLPASTPTPPPLKPAPSPFSNTFPSLGQMPNLVPGAPAPKSSPTLPSSEREEGGVLSGYPKTAALVSPGPVTISSPSQENTSSVALTAPVDANQKPSMWGSTSEGIQVGPLQEEGFFIYNALFSDAYLYLLFVFQTPKTPALAPAGFGKQSSEGVFGNVSTQTNGSSQGDKPFGFSFRASKDSQRQDSDTSQNLFFQFISQNQSNTQGQSKAFTPLSECLNKEPPSLFKSAAPSEGFKKTVVAPGSTGLFGSAPASGLSPLKEQPKVPDIKPAGNGILMSKPFGAVGEAHSKLPATFPSAIVQAASSTEVLKPSLGLGTSGLGNASGGIRNVNSSTPVSSFGLLAGNKVSDGHENLFLQASKETNSFLAYGRDVPQNPFSALTSPKSSSALSSSAVSPSGSTSLLSQDPPGNDAKPNLFTMAEPPKGILAPQFAAPALMTTPSFTSVAQDGQQTSKPNKEESDDNSETLLSTEGEGVSVPFEQSKFSLEERGQSIKKDSESSSNSDLSDLSEGEDNSGQSQKPDVSAGNEDKNKAQGVAKSRPRSKPFKGKT